MEGLLLVIMIRDAFMGEMAFYHGLEIIGKSHTHNDGLQ